jgi:hypothetical protein
MDKQYWDKFYNKESLSKDISKCSSFALDDKTIENINKIIKNDYFTQT